MSWINYHRPSIWRTTYHCLSWLFFKSWILFDWFSATLFSWNVPTISSPLRVLITYVHGTVFFLLSWSKRFRQTKLSVSLCKNNSLIWYHTILINFEVSVFIIILSTMVNIVTQLNIGKLHFDCYMIHSVIHVNCFIYLHVFWYCIHMLVDLTLQSSDKIS